MEICAIQNVPPLLEHYDKLEPNTILLLPQGRRADQLHPEQQRGRLLFVLVVRPVGGQRPAAQVHAAAQLLHGHGGQVRHFYKVRA